MLQKPLLLIIFFLRWESFEVSLLIVNCLEVISKLLLFTITSTLWTLILMRSGPSSLWIFSLALLSLQTPSPNWSQFSVNVPWSRLKLFQNRSWGIVLGIFLILLLFWQNGLVLWEGSQSSSAFDAWGSSCGGSWASHLSHSWMWCPWFVSSVPGTLQIINLIYVCIFLTRSAECDVSPGQQLNLWIASTGRASCVEELHAEARAIQSMSSGVFWWFDYISSIVFYSLCMYLLDRWQSAQLWVDRPLCMGAWILTLEKSNWTNITMSVAQMDAQEKQGRSIPELVIVYHPSFF